MGDYGLDSFYFAPIGIGTPEMTLNVVLDTGSADFWLADSQCSPMKHCPESMLKYDASKSRTHKDLHVPFGVQYGSGAVRGELATEKVSLAGYTVSSVSFGQADQLARGTINPPASGIMGMGYESLSTTGTMPFWQILLERQKLHDYLFTFQMVNNLKKASSGRVDMVEAGGVFTLGVLDDQQYSGDIAWAPMARGYGSKGVGYWALNLEDLSVNGEHIDLGTHSVAAIDTGTTLIGGPKFAMDRIHAKIPGAQRYNRVPEYYVFPCDTDAKVDLTFGNHTWTLKTEDLISQRLSRRVCLSSLFAMSTRSGSRMPAWIVGDTFLKTVFSVFDAGKNRIGFGSLPKGGAQTKSITSATMDNRVASSYQQTASSEGSPFGGGGGGGGGPLLHSAASTRYRCKDSGVSNTALSSRLSSSWKRNSSPSRYVNHTPFSVSYSKRFGPLVGLESHSCCVGGCLLMTYVPYEPRRTLITPVAYSTSHSPSSLPCGAFSSNASISCVSISSSS